MERSLITLVGTSGSGKTTLGKNLVEQLRPDMSIEHISTGNLIRQIGRGVVESACYQTIIDHLNSTSRAQRIDEDVMYTVISEALRRADESDVVILDGAPRSPRQVNDVSDLAIKDYRSHVGTIVTCLASEETNIARLLKRSGRAFSQKLTYSEAVERLDYSSTALDTVIDELTHNGTTPHYVETSSLQKSVATQRGLEVVRLLLGPIPNGKL